MLQKYNRYKLLKVFLDSPLEDFRLRELSRISRISPPSVVNHLREFENKDLIRRYNKRGIPVYRGCIDNEDFREYKKLSILFELHDSGFTNFLWKKFSPDAIILYGSYAKGESTNESDLDIFIIGEEGDLELGKFEKKLGKKIHIIFEDNIKKISPELKNNLINGIVLKGYLKLF